MQKTNSGPEAKAEIEREANLKKRAARAAVKREAIPVSHEQVECTVLPAGHDKISMGQHVGGVGEAHYEEDEKFTTSLPNAIALYDRGLVNFDGARQASAEAKEARSYEDRVALAEKRLQDKVLGGEG